MEKKVVHQASQAGKFRDPNEPLRRALDLIISKQGVFRTDERWVWDAALPLVESGHLVASGNTLSIGANFEPLLLKLAESDYQFGATLKLYRTLLNSRVAEFSLHDSTVMEKLSEFPTTDEKIIYLTSILAETCGKLEKALEKTAKLEAMLHELDVSLSVVESITFDENTDG
jgi:hypothetical protein